MSAVGWQVLWEHPIEWGVWSEALLLVSLLNDKWVAEVRVPIFSAVTLLPLHHGCAVCH